MLGIEEPFLPRLCERVIEVMGGAYPELRRERDTIERWARAEEESFGRTLEQGERLLAELIERAKAEETSWVSAEDAFKLHDTYGFPYEITKELLAEEGLAVDDQGFEELMEQAREVRARRRQRRPATAATCTDRGVLRFAREAGFEHALRGLRGHRGGDRDPRGRARERPAAREARGEPLLPGGRRPGVGLRRRRDAVRPRAGGRRLPPRRRPGGGARAGRGRARRRASACARSWTATRGSPRCATTPPRTSCTPRCASASARTCARPARTWARTSCASTSPTASGSRRGARATWRRAVNDWIADSHTVRAVETTRDEAERSARWRCSARSTATGCAWWRSTDVSRELCGGTHVGTTAEVGLFHVTQETSSASNVRRIEAVTGAGGVELFRARTEGLRELATLLRVPEREVVGAVERLNERVEAAAKRAEGRDRTARGRRARRRAPRRSAGVRVVAQVVDGWTPRRCSTSRTGPPEARRRRGRARHGRRGPCASGRELRARGGDGASRPATWCAPPRRWWAAAAVGATPWRRPVAATRRSCLTRSPLRGLEIEQALGLMRVLALDYGEARCGCAVSDPTGTLATPLEAVERPDTAEGSRGAGGLVEESEVERVVVGLPLTLAGEEGEQAAAGARIRRAPRAETASTRRAPRRTAHHAPSRAHRRARATPTRAPRRTCSRAIWPRAARDTSELGPPPVPGGRCRGARGRAPRARGAARRSQGRARTRRGSDRSRRLRPADGRARPLARGRRAADRGRPQRPPRRRAGPRWGRCVAAAIAWRCCPLRRWFLISLFQPFKGDGEGAGARERSRTAPSLGRSPRCSRSNGRDRAPASSSCAPGSSGRSGELKPGTYDAERGHELTAALDALEEGAAERPSRSRSPRAARGARSRRS